MRAVSDKAKGYIGLRHSILKINPTVFLAKVHNPRSWTRKVVESKVYKTYKECESWFIDRGFESNSYLVVAILPEAEVTNRAMIGLNEADFSTALFLDFSYEHSDRLIRKDWVGFGWVDNNLAKVNDSDMTHAPLILPEYILREMIRC